MQMMSDTISREAGCPACGCGVPCGECETCSPTPTSAPAPQPERRCARCGNTGRVIAKMTEDGRNGLQRRTDKVEIACPACFLWRNPPAAPAPQPWTEEELAKRLATWRYTNGAPREGMWLPASCDYIEADVILSRPLPAQPIRVCCCGECGPLEPEQPWTEGELAKAMHAERLEREGCRSNYADERWDESKADRERWYASARVALSRPLAGPVVVDYSAAAVVVYGGDGHYSHDALTKARAIVDAALKGAR